MKKKKEIQKLEAWYLDTAEGRYGESLIDDIKLTERNITAIVQKINEIVEHINNSQPTK